MKGTANSYNWDGFVAFVSSIVPPDQWSQNTHNRLRTAFNERRQVVTQPVAVNIGNGSVNQGPEGSAISLSFHSGEESPQYTNSQGNIGDSSRKRKTVSLFSAVFNRGDRILQEEDIDVEFKESSLCPKTLNGFLNSNTGGVLALGVCDDLYIKGVSLDLKRRDLLKQRICNVFSSFSVSSKYYRIELSPVLENGLCQDMFIVKVHVEPFDGRPTVFTPDGFAYIRAYAQTINMRGLMIEERYKAHYKKVPSESSRCIIL